ncbi:MAG TPA: TIGR00730 family Rossman fold protein [Bryobacteraceae bacterium]|nr:TIGR00730 family Rossman fold protein [Bryobacteraceae bacterium]
MRRICVFCGSNVGERPEYREAAVALGRLLARKNYGLVYGGGRVGLMGALAGAALDAGGEVAGVMPRSLVEKEIAHTGLSELHVTGSMHERKAMMEELSDAFILLPGGFGSWDEFCEILTWAQLGIHSKPCGVLNVAGYYDSFFAQMDHAVAEGFVRPSHQRMIVVEQDVELLLARLESAPPVVETKWGKA